MFEGLRVFVEFFGEQIVGHSVGEQILLPAKARDARERERTDVRDRSSKEQQRRQATKYAGNGGL